MTTRRNQRDLSAGEKKALVDAVLALKNTVDSVLRPGKQKRYDDFVEVHKNAMVAGPAMFMPMPHRTPLFYPWHRILLRQFELALQAVDASVAIPYWDWRRSGASDPFTPDFLGGDGDAADHDRVQSGPFAFAAGKFPIRVWDKPTGDAGLRRQMGDDPQAYLPTDAQVTSGRARIPYWPGSSSFEVVSEGALHNPVHNWVGGNMAEATSPNDPVFFLHHARLDLLWEQWRAQHPTSSPYDPTSGVAGYDLDSRLVFNKPGKPAPWPGSWTVRETLDVAALGYGYA